MFSALIDWINAHFPAEDKLRHFATGTVGAFATVWLCLWVDLWVPASIVTVVAVGKELWDRQHQPHQADPWDAAATIMGALPIWIVWAVSHG